MKTILFIQNIPTPYRVSFFNVLSEKCASHNLRLVVAYCSSSEYNRHWKIDKAEYVHEHLWLRGVSPVIGGVTFHFNPGVYRAIKMLRPDVVVHGGSWHMPTGFFARGVPKSGRVDIFWSEGHADAVRNPRGLIAMMRRRSLARFDGFAVPNYRSSQWIEKEVGMGVPLIKLPNSVDEVFFDAGFEIDLERLRSRLGLQSGERIFLQVSQLEKRKGVLPLIEAYKSLSDECRDGTCLVILGEGTLRADVDKLVFGFRGGGRVLVPGHVDKSGVRDWLRVAEWFVLNTFVDPNPLSPLEASLMGVPSLLSVRAGNCEEIVLGGQAGIVIPDPSNPVDAIKDAIETPLDLRNAMGVRARENALAGFARESIAESFISDLKAHGFL